MLNLDEMIVVPYTTVQEYLLGINYYHEIVAKATSETDVSLAVEEIKATMREQHNITDPSKDDFHVRTQADIVQRVGIVTDVLTALLLSVAAISLVVGGIGIMNIMLVSVTERTREIGLRKAVGATPRDILLQFLIEAIFLSLTGGAIGILLGAAGSLALRSFVQTSVTLWSVVLASGFSAGIGIIFGVAPAIRASRLDPIEALRYE